MKKSMKVSLLILFIAVTAVQTIHGDDNTTKDAKGKHLDIIEDGRILARYMYAHDTSTKDSRHNTYKPFLHVMSPDGKSPITKGPGGKFTHHRGIFLGWNKIKFQGKNYDLWHMKTSEIIHQAFVTKESSDDKTTVKVRLHWMDSNDKVILMEVRTMVFDHKDPTAFFSCDFTCELTALTDDVELNGDPEHAGFQYRPSNEVAENKSAKYLFHKEGIKPQKDRDLPWVALNYQTGGKTYSVQHMNHPNNPKGSVYSAYRDYGRFGSFPKTSIKKGKTLKLKYKIKVSEGEFPERTALEAAYKKFAGAF